MFEIVTRRSRAATAAERWEQQYDTPEYRNTEHQYTALQLKALPLNPDPDEVDRLIGNSTWTDVPACDGCGKGDRAFVVHVGGYRRTAGIPMRDAMLCIDCLDYYMREATKAVVADGLAKANEERRVSGLGAALFVLDDVS